LPKLNTQSIQASVASALLSAAIIALPLGIALYLLSGEWQRAKRTALMALVVIPLALLLRRYLQQGQVRPVLFSMSLLVWASMSLQLMTAGTIISPSLPILISVSVIGALAHERLLSWLMPLLCTLSIVSAAVLERLDLLPHNLPPSGFSLVLGSLLGIVFLALLTRISSDHLAHSQQLQHDSNQRLQDLSAQLQLAIEAGNITCFSLDPSSLKLQISNDASGLLQCAKGEHALRQLAVFSQVDQQRIAQACQRVLHGAAFPNLTCQLHSGPSQGRWYRLFAAHSHEQTPKLICALQDIHEQQQAELAKENFTAMVSHELRTPLTALLGAMRLLQGLHQQSLPANGQELLNIAVRGGDRLAALVNDILDFSKLQAGHMHIPCQLQPLQPMLEQAIDSVQPLLQARAQSLHVIGLEPKQNAYFDSSRGQQVLINLLGNAIKFSPPHSPLWLSVQLDDQYARISLRDSGPGIAEAFQPQMFEPFTQANMGNTRDNDSTGLGLAISRQLMRQMGGELSYSGQAGAGATFHADFLRRPANRLSE
jgi:C4-dicarboxylate-specific signal transduction histidine kinase